MRESKSRALPLGYTPIWLVLKAKDRSGRSGPSALRAYGVGDGTRTRDTRNHNPMLYQLSYYRITTRLHGAKEIVRAKRLELLRHRHQILSLARLPFRHARTRGEIRRQMGMTHWRFELQTP